MPSYHGSGFPADDGAHGSRVGEPVHPEPVNGSILSLMPEWAIPMMFLSLDGRGIKGKGAAQGRCGLFLITSQKVLFGLFASPSFFFFKIVFAGAADRAGPIIGQVFK
jgi:hypothetical protein